MANQKFDVVIVGAGLVGASLALALRDCAVSVAVVEARLPAPLAEESAWDNRIYAISPGSADFLQQLGVWSTLPPQRLQAIEAMEIFGDDGKSRLDFSAYEAGLGRLAYIAESARLQAALWHAMQQAPHITLCCPAACSALTVDAAGAHLQLEDGSRVQAQLLVGADGAHSWVRQQAGIAAKDKDYRQRGVVANFITELPHRGTALQWFRTDGVLAYLPLPGNRISIVWSAQEELAQELLQLAPAELCQRVAAAGHLRLGALQLLTPPAAFPLHLIDPQALIGAHVALIGDAAHQVHPLAGQGVNLGFGDARALAQVLRARGPRACGERLLLRRYERERAEHILAMQLVTDGLQNLFQRQRPMLGWLRNTGLAATNRMGWLKQQLLTQALGRNI